MINVGIAGRNSVQNCGAGERNQEWLTFESEVSIDLAHGWRGCAAGLRSSSARTSVRVGKDLSWVRERSALGSGKVCPKMGIGPSTLVPGKRRVC